MKKGQLMYPQFTKNFGNRIKEINPAELTCFPKLNTAAMSFPKHFEEVTFNKNARGDSYSGQRILG